MYGGQRSKSHTPHMDREVNIVLPQSINAAPVTPPTKSGLSFAACPRTLITALPLLYSTIYLEVSHVTLLTRLPTSFGLPMLFFFFFCGGSLGHEARLVFVDIQNEAISQCHDSTIISQQAVCRLEAYYYYCIIVFVCQFQLQFSNFSCTPFWNAGTM